MASFRDDFQHFYAPSEDAVAAALRTGLVTPDTNVLLSLYRIQSGARDDLFRALERLEDRLWIPHQVALEFHRKRLTVINTQEKYFDATREELNSALKNYVEKVKAFAGRIALPKERERQLEKVITGVHKMVIEDVDKAEESNDVQVGTLNSDEVLNRLEDLFENKVGAAMSPHELGDARKEALRRVEAKIPPGYMDKAKTDPTGDYLIWAQLKQEAAQRKLPTVFITDDRKEDWYRREYGMTLGARIELQEEMQAEASVSFIVMTLETFLVQAKKYLDVAVSPETVDQAKELPSRLDYDNAVITASHAQMAAEHSQQEVAVLDERIKGVKEQLRLAERNLERQENPDETAEDEAARRAVRTAEIEMLRQRLYDFTAEHSRASLRARYQMTALDDAQKALAQQRLKSHSLPPMGEDQILAEGDRIYHSKFGIGTVLSSIISNGEMTYSIGFDDPQYSKKVIVPMFAPMVKL